MKDYKRDDDDDDDDDDYDDDDDDFFKRHLITETSMVLDLLSRRSKT